MYNQSSKRNTYAPNKILALVAALTVVSSVQASAPQAEKGKASWYGKELAGRKTASGEIFDPAAFTAAHRTHPFGTQLKVTRDSTGQSVIVRVNDRGPNKPERIIDLSEAAARQLGLIVDGVGDVTIEVVSPTLASQLGNAKSAPAPSKTQSTTTPAQATYRLQLGAFESSERAEALRDALKADHPDVTISAANVSGKDFFRVRLGAYTTMDEALADLKKLMNAGYSEVAVVRTTQDETFISVEKTD